MRVGIICAGDDELAPFLPLIEDCIVTEKTKLKFYSGTIHGVQVTALYSGVCKVNAAVAAQLLIEEFKADAVINSGAAGGMDPDVEILDTVISTQAVYHDVAADVLTDFHPWMETEIFYADDKLVELSKAAVGNLGLTDKVHYGRTATGEAFIDDSGRYEINEKYAPLSVDMETAAIAHVCYVFNVPFIAIRSITDTARHSGEANFELNCKNASETACRITAGLLKELNKNAGK